MASNVVDVELDFLTDVSERRMLCRLQSILEKSFTQDAGACSAKDSLSHDASLKATVKHSYPWPSNFITLLHDAWTVFTCNILSIVHIIFLSDDDES